MKDKAKPIIGINLFLPNQYIKRLHEPQLNYMKTPKITWVDRLICGLEVFVKILILVLVLAFMLFLVACIGVLLTYIRH